MPDDLTRALANELIAASLAVDTAAKNLVAARILFSGERQFEKLKKEVCADIAAFRQPYARALGTGSVFAEFAISGVPLGPDYCEAVCALGGLIILIVSAFDVLLDAGGTAPDLLPPERRVGRAGDARNGSVVAALLDVYFRRLDELPQTRPGVRAIVDSAIRRMYLAELQSRRAGREIGRSAWWRKNALPIMVLGVPAWMAACSFEPRFFRRHLMWLGRVGEFFGWLDDCVDYEDDLAGGHANRIHVLLRMASTAQVARHIAWQGRRILFEWDSWNDSSSVRDVLAVIVWAWIENKPALAVC